MKISPHTVHCKFKGERDCSLITGAGKWVKQCAPLAGPHKWWGAGFSYCLFRTSSSFDEGGCWRNKDKEKDSGSLTDVWGQPPINHQRRKEAVRCCSLSFSAAIMGPVCLLKKTLLDPKYPSNQPPSFMKGKESRRSRVSSFYCAGIWLRVHNAFHSALKLILEKPWKCQKETDSAQTDYFSSEQQVLVLTSIASFRAEQNNVRHKIIVHQ